MDLTVIFATAFVVGFSGAMMPGPLLTVTIAEAARRGWSAGPLIVLGHALLELALIAALAGGLSVYLTRAGVSHTIAVLGGIFLLYMGYGMTKDAWTGKVSLPVLGHGKTSDTPVNANPRASSSALENADTVPSPETGQLRLNPVSAGILISLSNPFWFIWWATVGLSYITISLNKGIPGLASFFTGHILADLVWYTLIAIAIAGSMRFLSNRIYRGILVACGVFLVGMGGYFLYSGLFVFKGL